MKIASMVLICSFVFCSFFSAKIFPGKVCIEKRKRVSSGVRSVKKPRRRANRSTISEREARGLKLARTIAVAYSKGNIQRVRQAFTELLAYTRRSKSGNRRLKLSMDVDVIALRASLKGLDCKTGLPGRTGRGGSNEFSSHIPPIRRTSRVSQNNKLINAVFEGSLMKVKQCLRDGADPCYEHEFSYVGRLPLFAVAWMKDYLDIWSLLHCSCVAKNR